MENIQKCLDYFAKDREKTVTAVSCFGGMTSKGDIFSYGNSPCHASLNGMKSKEKLKYVVSQHQKPFASIEREDHLKWVDYFVNRSPWKDVHILKDAEKILDGCYILDPETDKNLLASACIVSRFNTESNKLNFAYWAKLVKDGVKEDIATLLSHIFKLDDNKVSYHPYYSHNSFHPVNSMGPKGCSNFLEGKYNKNGSYQNSRNYTRVSEIWGNSDVRSLSNNCISFVPSNGAKAKYNFNIFFKVRRDYYKAWDDSKENNLELEQSFEGWLK